MILLLQIAAMLLLAAGTYRQSRLLFGTLPAARVRLALLGGGYALLGISLALVLTGPDLPRRLVEWFGLLTLAALGIILFCWVRSKHPRRLSASPHSSRRG